MPTTAAPRAKCLNRSSESLFYLSADACGAVLTGGATTVPPLPCHRTSTRCAAVPPQRRRATSHGAVAPPRGHHATPGLAPLRSPATLLLLRLCRHGRCRRASPYAPWLRCHRIWRAPYQIYRRASRRAQVPSAAPRRLVAAPAPAATTNAAPRRAAPGHVATRLTIRRSPCSARPAAPARVRRPAAATTAVRRHPPRSTRTTAGKSKNAPPPPL